METPTLKELSVLIKENNVKYFPKRKIILRKMTASAALITCDIALLAFSMLFSLFVRSTFWEGEVNPNVYSGLLPIILIVFPIVFAMRGLYPGFGKDVIYEIKNLSYSITIVFALLGTFTFLIKGEWEFSRMAFLFSWLISITTVPIGRAYIRHKFSKSEWWGVPVMIIGAGKAGGEVIKSLNIHSHIGLKPIVAVDDNPDRWGYNHNVPVIGGLNIIPQLAKKLNIEHAIIAMPGVSPKIQREIIERYSKYFDHTTVIPDVFGLSSLWVNTNEIGGVLGLEVQQRLLRVLPQVQKRVFDIVLATSIGLLALPLIAIVSILIWIDSRGKGKVFFKQVRMGLNDSRFSIVKFRTMHVDAEQRLKEILSHNPALKAEYDMYHKMQYDPRLTKIGKILRKFSIDELPQFWNVIKGEMSLIGPRAYMPWEKIKMDRHDEMILKVKPGISGFWQVTDRNESTFEERLHKDIYYIRNWSMFLDLYILARTISVVFMGKGA